MLKFDEALARRDTLDEANVYAHTRLIEGPELLIRALKRMFDSPDRD